MNKLEELAMRMLELTVLQMKRRSLKMLIGQM
jgi:hypothetical protein